MPSEPLEVVYFGAVDWGYTWQRPQQIASRMAALGRVVYVNPIGLRSARPSDAWRLLRRLWSTSAPHSPEASVLRVRSLPAVTAAVALGASTDRAAAMLNGTLRALLERERFQRPVLWAGTPLPALAAALDRLPWRAVVYDCLDAVTAFPSRRDDVPAAEAALASRADVVFAASAPLESRMRRYNPAVVPLPNAVDYDHFSRRVRDDEVPGEIRRLRRPVLGYVGEVAEWLDSELVLTLARRHPAWSVVLVGPATSAARRALQAPNVHVLGRRPYGELPRYLAGFDCGLIPFRVTPLTIAASPIKLYEYLAAGKPVVSTPLPAVQPFEGEVRMGAGAAFLEHVEQALSRPEGPLRVEARRRRVRAHTWDARMAPIVRALESVQAMPAAAPVRVAR